MLLMCRFLVPKLLMRVDACLHGVFVSHLFALFVVLHAQGKVVQRDIGLIELVVHGVPTLLNHTVLSLRMALSTLLSLPLGLIVHLKRVATSTADGRSMALAALILVVGLVAGGR